MNELYLSYFVGYGMVWGPWLGGLRVTLSWVFVFLIQRPCQLPWSLERMCVSFFMTCIMGVASVCLNKVIGYPVTECYSIAKDGTKIFANTTRFFFVEVIFWLGSAKYYLEFPCCPLVSSLFPILGLISSCFVLPKYVMKGSAIDFTCILGFLFYCAWLVFMLQNVVSFQTYEGAFGPFYVFSYT